MKYLGYQKKSPLKKRAKKKHDQKIEQEKITTGSAYDVSNLPLP